MLNIENLGYEVDGRKVFDDVSFSINKGDKIGLVGANGVGKTTLLRLLSNEIIPTKGNINASDYEVGLLPQDLSDWLDKTVYEFVGDVTGVNGAKNRFEESCSLLGQESNDRTIMIYSDALEAYNKLEVSNFDGVLNKALAQAGLPDIDVDKRLEKFSGGQKTRISLAALFASRYDVILLDEPTNNLDKQGIVLLEKFINNSSAAFLMVSHDRKFLRAATTRIIELIGGDDGVEQYGLGYDEYVACREVARQAAAEKYDHYEVEKKRLKRAAKKLSAKAISASSNKSKADNDKLTAHFRKEKAASTVSRQAQGIGSRIAQLDEPEKPAEEISLSFSFNEFGHKKVSLMHVDNLTARYPGVDKSFGPISFNIHNGDKVSISGENGVGKTTLLKVLAGQLKEHSGAYSVGREAKIIYIDQQQSVPLPDKSAVDNIRQLAPHLQLHDAIILLLKFNLKKDVISYVPANKLSGGERAKILLAAIVANRANLLILDEPTNNLDITTIEALESSLKSFKGSLIVTSHDQEFLDNLGIDQEIKIR